MSGLLIVVGILLVFWGFFSKRKETKFDLLMNEMVENSDETLNETMPSTDIISVSSEIADRLDNIEERLKLLEIKEEVGYKKVLKDIDIANKSVEEIARATGMNKGEILLLKRFLKE
ncbi:MAG: hypothetical protein JW702_00535 [Clostridiales bacterium]|nr:hypothetical protein [Clostridiales bacterium]